MAEQYSNIWSQDEGFQIMQNMLQAHPDVTIVFAQADALALGAAQAIKVANPSGKIWLAGFDGDTAALTALKNGVFDVTATQQAEAEAKQRPILPPPDGTEDRQRGLFEAVAGPTSINEQLGEMMGDAPMCDQCGHITVRNGSCRSWLAEYANCSSKS